MSANVFESYFFKPSVGIVFSLYVGNILDCFIANADGHCHFTVKDLYKIHIHTSASFEHSVLNWLMAYFSYISVKEAGFTTYIINTL